jgi:hypothetical protein
MKWTVVWLPDAEAQLANLWLNALDRRQLARACNEIDRILKLDPLNAGEGRDGVNRMVIYQPLVVSCDVSEPDRMVTVLAVWRYPDENH